MPATTPRITNPVKPPAGMGRTHPAEAGSPLAASSAARAGSNRAASHHEQNIRPVVTPARAGLGTRAMRVVLLPYTLVSSALSFLNFTPYLSMGIAAVGGSLAFVARMGGKLLGKENAGQGITSLTDKTQNAIQTPTRFAATTTIGDIPHLASDTLKNVSARVRKSGRTELSRKMFGNWEKVRSAEKGVFSTVSSYASRGFDAIGSIIKRIAGEERLARWSRKADDYERDAKLLRTESALHLQEAQSTLQGFDGAGELVRKITPGMSLNKASELVSAAETGLNKTLKGLAKDDPTKAIAEKGMKHAGMYVSGQATAKGMEERATMLRDPGKGLKQKVAATNLMTAAYIGTTAVSTALSSAAIAKMAKNRLTIAKEMHQDITGKKASTFKILFGSLPKEMRAARSAVIKEVVPQIAMQAVSTALSLGLIRTGKGGASFIVSMFGFQGMNMAASYLSSTSPLAHYAAIKEGLAANQEVPPGLYAEFLARVSPDAKAAGAENRLTRALAMEYAAAKMTPSAIINEIHIGEFNKRALDIKAKWDSVAKPVVGDHTAKLVGNRIEAALAKPAPVGMGAG